MMKKNYKEMTKPERQAEYAAVKAEFEGAKALHLELNMARGKPSRQQLDMVTPMLQVLTQPEQFVSDGVETRNYGEVAGIPAARKLFADILGCKPEQVFVGGYFISVDTMHGCAKRTLELCREAGITMTGAGATFPYGKDPNDSNIRIAPSLPPVAELEQAIAVFCICLRLAALEKLGV